MDNQNRNDSSPSTSSEADDCNNINDRENEKSEKDKDQQQQQQQQHHLKSTRRRTHQPNKSSNNTNTNTINANKKRGGRFDRFARKKKQMEERQRQRRQEQQSNEEREEEEENNHISEIASSTTRRNISGTLGSTRNSSTNKNKAEQSTNTGIPLSLSSSSEARRRSSVLDEIEQARIKKQDTYDHKKSDNDDSLPRIFEVEHQLLEDDIEEEVSPGAYSSPGRAFGQYPAWARRNREEVQQGQRQYDNNNNNVWCSTTNSNASVSGVPPPVQHGNDNKQGHVVAAVVEKEDLEASIRRHIIDEAVQAEVVVNVDDDMNNNSSNRKTRRMMIICAVLFSMSIIIIIGLVVGFTVVGKGKKNCCDPPTDQPSLQPSEMPTDIIRPRLDRIKEKNKLVCAIPDGDPGLAEDTSSGMLGFNVDLCRAVAAGIFGNNTPDDHIEYNHIGINDFDKNEEDTDLLIQTITYTIQRDVMLSSSTNNLGYTFSAPYLYDGLLFGGYDNELVNCANRVQSFVGKCKSLKICVCDTCTHNDKIRFMFPERAIISTPSNKIVETYVNGSCNVIANELTLFTTIVRNLKANDDKIYFNKTFVLGKNIFSKEPLAMVTRQNDPVFSDFVNYILQALFEAEKQNFTKQEALRVVAATTTTTDNETTTNNKWANNNSSTFFITTNVFGEQYKNMFLDAVAAVGNYKEIYDRNLHGIIKRQRINEINVNGNTGLIYSFSFRGVDKNGTNPTRGGTLERIISRGYLRCGIITTSFTIGMDMDYCRALSAGIFGANDDGKENVVIGGNEKDSRDVRFEEFFNTSSREYFVALANESIDVLAGASVTLENDVLEPTTQVGFSFSQPYFYNGSNLDLPPIALATRQDDPQFSDFVRWEVASTFYAEEESVSKSNENYDTMPLVHLFGPKFQHMFQDTIKAVGNYGEIYNQRIEKIFPRNNTNNMLNKIPYGPQHYSLL